MTEDNPAKVKSIHLKALHGFLNGVMWNHSMAGGRNSAGIILLIGNLKSCSFSYVQETALVISPMLLTGKIECVFPNRFRMVFDIPLFM